MSINRFQPPVLAGLSLPPLVTDTIANIYTNYDPADFTGYKAIATNLNNLTVKSDGVRWAIDDANGTVVNFDLTPSIVAGFGASGSASYTRVGALVTVTGYTHLMTAADQNGAKIWLPQNTGLLLSGWYTNFTYISATSFTCVSSITNADTSGTLGTNVSETFLEQTYTLPSAYVFSIQTFPLTHATTKSPAIAGVRTYRNYFSSQLITSGALSTSGFWGSSSGATMQFLNATQFYVNGVTITPPVTVIDRTFTYSLQVSSNAVYAMAIVPSIRIQERT